MVDFDICQNTVPSTHTLTYFYLKESYELDTSATSTLKRKMNEKLNFCLKMVTQVPSAKLAGHTLYVNIIFGTMKSVVE